MIGETLLTVAALIWIVDVMPQLIKTYKRKNAEGLSVLMFGLAAAANICFEAGNLLTGNMLYFWLYLIPLIITVSLFLLILKYRKA